jgi:fused signal recognition particle receptor
MDIFVILVGIVALVAVYFLFFKKEAPPALPPEREPRKVLEKAPPKKPAAAPGKQAPPKPTERRAEGEAPLAPPVEAAAVPVEVPEPEPAPPSHAIAARRVFPREADVGALRTGLARSRDEGGFFGKLKALFTGRPEIDASIAEEVEEVLLSSDVGVPTAQAILTQVREKLGRGELKDSGRVWEELREEAARILDVDGKAGPFTLRAKPTVVLMVGVNGAGKTTTIGKLATKFRDAGLTCILAAGDTFRAAAVQQLEVWGKRVGCQVVTGKDGADPGSVVYDAIQKALETNADIVLADTAGRLHTKSNLMQEMQKIARTAGKAMAGAPHEVLLVIDATNGQNAMAQAQEFTEALDLSGIVLTKLDGTAKGGVILGISNTLGIPVRFVGLGERPDDLHDFSPNAFAEALLGRDEPS